MKCGYRNCLKELPVGQKSNQLYCNVNCRTCEGKYRKRKEQFIEKYKKKGLKEVEYIKYIKSLING